MRETSVQDIDRDDAWDRVVARDRSFDGVFYYAVRTTGIFCRPSCPSRRPRRTNVEFFGSAEAAEGAGYRACHRCHPKSETGTPTERRLRRAMDYIDAHRDERITLRDLSRAVGLSPFHLQRSFKELLGMSPREYQDARRLEAMKGELKSGTGVGRAVWEAGYGSTRGAYESVSDGVGMTPGEYRKGGRGLSIRYAVHDTRFGWLLVAWTARGVCAVSLGASEEEVIGELRDEFSAARLERDQAAGRWLDPFLSYLEGRSPGLAVPVDTRGTAFQRRVWQALRRIPVGEVRTYGAVAASIGRPGSARAVAQACAANRIALAVPCHRVVRSDGSTGGYRWDENRKRRLLEHERSLREENA